MILENSNLQTVQAKSELNLSNKAKFFAFDKFTLQDLANKSGDVQTNLLYFLYITSEVKQYHEAFLYHTDLGQNAVFHNFAIQIALTQYSG